MTDYGCIMHDRYRCVIIDFGYVSMDYGFLSMDNGFLSMDYGCLMAMYISPHVSKPPISILTIYPVFMSTIYLVFRIPHFPICHLPHFSPLFAIVFLAGKLSAFSLRKCFLCLTFSKNPVPIPH